MIGYVTLGSNDLEKSKAFYDALTAELGGQRTFANDRMQGYGSKAGAMLAVCTPHDGSPATAGNGTMFSFAAPGRIEEPAVSQRYTGWETRGDPTR